MARRVCSVSIVYWARRIVPLVCGQQRVIESYARAHEYRPPPVQVDHNLVSLVVSDITCAYDLHERHPTLASTYHNTWLLAPLRIRNTGLHA